MYDLVNILKARFTIEREDDGDPFDLTNTTNILCSLKVIEDENLVQNKADVYRLSLRKNYAYSRWARLDDVKLDREIDYACEPLAMALYCPKLGICEVLHRFYILITDRLKKILNTQISQRILCRWILFTLPEEVIQQNSFLNLMRNRTYVGFGWYSHVKAVTFDPDSNFNEVFSTGNEIR